MPDIVVGVNAQDERRADRSGAFAFTARVAVLLLVGVPTLWIAVALAPAIHGMRLVRLWARIFLRASGCRVRIEGADHLSPDGCAVFVANHGSVVDPVVLAAAIPGRYRFVINDEAARLPFVRTIVRKAGHLVVDRKSVSSRAACERAMLRSLSEGCSLALFPEGRIGDGAMLPFNAGAFRTAIRAGRTVIPVAIAGTNRVLPRGGRMLRRASVAVRILPAISAPPDEQDVDTLRRRVETALKAALDDLTTPPNRAADRTGHSGPDRHPA